MISFVSGSPEETKKFGKKFGQSLKPGTVVALVGELGAGKTTLVKGIASGLDVPNEKEVASPTFVLVHEYQGRCKVYHLDWYRLESIQAADRELFEECFRPDAVTLIEWADRARNILPKGYIRIRLQHKVSNTRLITVHGFSK